ncbi:antitermination protein [Pantoea ananatis]|uniref:transcriptional antitermination N peptide n=1 Tax=Pantoea ananas TaxID=553 RepID=UPI0020793ED3|nr:antitermination protein [Pantoea ananatis]MCW0353986.1 hypothetical protein [Pantoea ananatis]
MTRRTQFTGSAPGRRRKRRAQLQSEASSSSEVLHRPTPGRVVLQYKRQVTPSVNRAVDTETEYHKQILAGAAAYVEYRINNKYLKVNNEAGRQIHAVQKKRGRMLPLI